MKACLYCAEQIQAAAILCRFCGRDVASVGARPKKGEGRTALHLPAQDWYNLDPRVRPLAVEVGRSSHTSVWTKVEESLGRRTSWRARVREALHPARDVANRGRQPAR